jgi:hypothetical protein
MPKKNKSLIPQPSILDPIILPQGNINDPVNHPNHYTNNTIECIDVILDVCKHIPGDEAALVANAIKYLWRYQHKGKPLEDVKKAQWYINKLAKVMESKQNDKS